VPDFERFWSDFQLYTELKHAHGEQPKTVLAPVRADIGYDLEAWVEAGLPKNPSPFRLDAPASFEFRLSAEGARELESALKMWTASLKGLSKLVTRVKTSWQVRECHPVGQTQFAVPA